MNIESISFSNVHPRMSAIPHLFVDGPFAGDKLDIDPTATEILIDGLWYNVDGGLIGDFPYLSLMGEGADAGASCGEVESSTYEVEIRYSGVLSYIVSGAANPGDAQRKAKALYESGEADHNPGCHDERADGYSVAKLPQAT